METPVVRSRGRPRKRRREEISDGKVNGGDVGVVVVKKGNEEADVQVISSVRKRGRPPKKRPVEVRGEAMVGRYVMKEFEGSGVFLGKIVSYDSGLYRVEYEDGDFEDLDSGELREFLIGDECGQLAGDLVERKRKLDEHVERKISVKLKNEPRKGDVVMQVAESEKEVAKATGKDVDERDIRNVQNDVLKVEVPTPSELIGGEANESEAADDDDDVGDDDDDLSSDSSEYGQGWETRSENEIPSVPPPELPLSTGNIGVPEGYVSHLFSVYGFLRSFSIRLFLSPFTLDDLVGCLTCTVPNTLLDSIHVVLLRALRRHLETLSSDGSELASKCLRCIDWGLLDMLTWPVYLVHYLMVMGHLNGDEWKGFCYSVLEKEYFTLSVEIKLTVLQILCDDTLDTAEVREAIDMREASELGVESDGFTSFENEPGKAFPRYGKNSAGKNGEIMGAENVLSFSSNSLIMKGNDRIKDVANVDEDGNGDDCRLCGMDGMLLCCDGCPSAYHSRCIGVNKLSIPEGEWFCPECTIGRIGPPITCGTSLKGAEVFGVDQYAQLFLGTCDHLLVLKVSVKTSPFVRYYSRNDIVKVINVLCSSQHHAISYLGICHAILKYWELPLSIIPPLLNGRTNINLEHRDQDMLPTCVLPFGENGNYNQVEFDNHAISVSDSSVDNVCGPSAENINVKLSLSGVSLVVPVQTAVASEARISDATMKQNAMDITSKLLEPAEFSCSAQQGLDYRSSVQGITSTSSTLNGCGTERHMNGVDLPEKTFMHQKIGKDGVGARTDQKWNGTCLYVGSLFKPHAYINHFVHGHYAASAAANFAVLLSDENRASEVHASDPRKAISAKGTLQAKAFSSAATRFFWPSTEKKLIEIPRERCSWCLHCKAPVTSKKACLLNQAALNATRAAMKFVSGHRLTKNVEGGLYSIAAYTLYMEESLRGLILGPFWSEDYRQQWRKKVEQVSTCSDMKSLLLELEGNLCTISLSSEWTKLVDNWMDEGSVPQSACVIGSAQKRGPGRRKKQLAAAEVMSDDSNDKPSDINWWRGGKLTKLVFQRAMLPFGVLKKAARQGASKKIPGIYYADVSDVPKRSRQFIWRAAVKMARNASQLALQVRYLDLHIKWSDLVRPEQTTHDGKGPETEAAFRNACICDKKTMDNKIIYAVAFGHQKHLSTRLMKSVIEKEESEDGKDKYWFLETRVPLYLIKEYEDNASKIPLLPPKESPPLSKLQRKQMKAYRKNIFHYLDRKKDGLIMCLCACCYKDVLINIAVKCSACEGYCHPNCTMSSTDENVKSVTCRQCSRYKVIAPNNGSVESPTSPLAMQGEYQHSGTATRSARSKSISQQYQNSSAVSKSGRQKVSHQQLPPVSTSDTLSDKKPASSDSNKAKSKKRLCHWGLIWKKKNIDDDGSDFRRKNILVRGNQYNVNAECHLCKKPYNPDLMYIFCDTCEHWYHADSVGLDESKLPNLLGFKCCRCRRIKSPICPYDDKKTEVKKLHIRGPKEEPGPASSVSEAISEESESVPSTSMSPMEDFIFEDDSHLLSMSEVGQLPEPKVEFDFDWTVPSAQGPQKLPVRRHIKNESDDHDITVHSSMVQYPAYDEMTNSVNPPLAEWDVSDAGFGDGTAFVAGNFGCENTDFEPHTYFSYTELLEADDGSQHGLDAPGGAWENLQCENSRSGFQEPCGLGSTIDNVTIESMEPAISEPCNICSQTAPSPNLRCQNCGLHFHSHCSPWQEFPQGETWSCGNCRTWC